jgi:hypothetical protein
MDWFASVVVDFLDEAMRADPDAECWCFLASWSVFEGWIAESAEAAGFRIPDRIDTLRSFWDTSWVVPVWADARLRLTIPAEQKVALERYLSAFQEAHVASTDSLADCLTCRLKVYRDHTELSIL